MEMLEELSREHLLAKTTLQNISKREIGDEILIPIGGRCFVFARISDTKKGIIALGADVSIEESLENMIERINGGITKIEDSYNKMNAQKEEIISEMQKISSTIEEVSKELGKM